MAASTNVGQQHTIHLRVDGERTTLSEFLTANTEDGESVLDPADVAAIEALSVGMSHTIYGGASGDTIIKRVKSPAPANQPGPTVDGFIANQPAEHRCTQFYQRSIDSAAIISRYPHIDFLTKDWSTAQRNELANAMLTERADGCEDGRKDIINLWNAEVKKSDDGRDVYAEAVAAEVRRELAAMRPWSVHDTLHDFCKADSAKHGSSAPREIEDGGLSVSDVITAKMRAPGVTVGVM